MNKDEIQDLAIHVISSSHTSVTESIETWFKNKIQQENKRIETLDNELAKLISILDKIAIGYDYPREHLLLIIDKAKFILQQD